jgi:hypothetical protein
MPHQASRNRRFINPLTTNALMLFDPTRFVLREQTAVLILWSVMAVPALVAAITLLANVAKLLT